MTPIAHPTTRINSTSLDWYSSSLRMPKPKPRIGIRRCAVLHEVRPYSGGFPIILFYDHLLRLVANDDDVGALAERRDASAAEVVVGGGGT